MAKQLLQAGEEGMGAGKEGVGAGEPRPSCLFGHLLCICILSKAPFQAKTLFLGC